MPLDLKRLQSAVVIAEEGNLSRAAERLRLSQSALSRRIQELERELAFPLFDHVGRGIRLTGEGQAFLERCRELLAHSEAVEENARTFASGDHGVLRLGASAQILEHLFPELLRRYGTLFPQVEVELFEDNQTNLLALLERGEIHFAISALPQNGRIESRVLAPSWVLAAVSHAHPLSRATRIEVSDLGNAPMLLVNKGFKARQVFDAVCQLVDLKPHIVLESSSPQTILALAEEGFGIAVFPSNTRISDRRLHIVPLVHDDAPLEMQLAINWIRGRHFARYASEFLEVMTDVANCTYEAGIPGKRQRRMTAKAG